MNKRILILESGIPVIPFEETLLLRRDNEVIRASSGDEALKILSSEKIDLLIVDEKLSDKNPLEFFNEIRSNEKLKNLSILYLSSSDEKPAGVNIVLKKPIQSLSFNEACKKLLNVEARRETRLLVYVQVQGFSQSNFFLCNSRNLSASGILILTSKYLKVGEQVQLQITLPREREKVKAFARVVREAKEVPTKLNAYGLEFTEISQKDRERIKRFIEEEKSYSESF